MNDLRLLVQSDKERKIINLQYKQITSLQPLIPILSKFQNLQSLSLCGNRLKSLPDLSMLVNLSQLDISSNLFSDYRLALPGLKSVPSLHHLIYTFKNDQQQNQLRNQLPNLQRLNKRPVNSRMMNKKVKKNQLKLEEKDLEQIGMVYDQIREVYKKSKYMVDKQLMQDFDKSVDIIMADLSQHLSSSRSPTQIDASIITCRYGLIDMCFTKVITYFYHFDKGIAVVLQKIHDYIAESFKSMGEIIKIQQQQMTTQLNKVRTKKQELYKAQIKRLKQKDSNSLVQIQFLSKKNDQLLRILTQYGRSSQPAKSLVQSFISQSPSKPWLRQKSQNQSNLPQLRKSQSKSISKIDEYDFRKSSKQLGLNQLKDVINQIYLGKVKQDRICVESGMKMETMEQFIYTYLNQKYGLKNLTIEWAMGIVNAIKKYGTKQPEIAVFGKVLKNQIQQGFHQQLKKLKNQLSTHIKKFKTSDDLLSFNECDQILLNCRYQRDTISLILSKVKQQYSSSLKIPQQRFQSSVLQYSIRQHQQQIKYFLSIFKKADRNQDGIVNRQELVDIVENCGKQVDHQILFQYVDPYMNQKITFSHVYQMFTKDQTYREILKRPQHKQ